MPIIKVLRKEIADHYYTQKSASLRPALIRILKFSVEFIVPTIYTQQALLVNFLLVALIG